MKDPIYSLLKLRVLVLALGEIHHAGWWKSQFLSPTGLSYLSRLYPRSNFAAAVRSASRAAKAVHDSSIGVGNAFHLFRLPQYTERRLDETLRDTEAELQTHLAPLLNQRDKLFEELQSLGNSAQVKTAVGPLRLGTLRELRHGNWVPQLSAAYYAAFRDGAKTFPYFEDEKAK